ncbi:hypothetical protein [Aquiflexum sp.]|uniref:hypothetical protein n=1 Tax=Aquiflexum sp. TaxID=1872584 RepID=UPI0035937498
MKQFKLRFGNGVHSELSTLKFCQNKKECFLEVGFGFFNPERKELKMDFISGEQILVDGREVLLNYFRPEKDIVDNAGNFLDFDDYSMINCFDELLTSSAIERIANEYSRAKANI